MSFKYQKNRISGSETNVPMLSLARDIPTTLAQEKQEKEFNSHTLNFESVGVIRGEANIEGMGFHGFFHLHFRFKSLPHRERITSDLKKTDTQ